MQLTNLAKIYQLHKKAQQLMVMLYLGLLSDAPACRLHSATPLFTYVKINWQITFFYKEVTQEPYESTPIVCPQKPSFMKNLFNF